MLICTLIFILSCMYTSQTQYCYYGLILKNILLVFILQCMYTSQTQKNEKVPNLFNFKQSTSHRRVVSYNLHLDYNEDILIIACTIDQAILLN